MTGALTVMHTRAIKDTGMLLKCYQLSDEETIRTVMDNPKPLRRPGAGRR